MGDWADLMEAFGGRLPRDIADAQMVPGYYKRPRKPSPVKVGDRIKLLVPTITGWMGYGTALEVQGTTIRFVKDGADANDPMANNCFCGTHECRKARRTPSTKEQA